MNEKEKGNKYGMGMTVEMIKVNFLQGGNANF